MKSIKVIFLIWLALYAFTIVEAQFSNRHASMFDRLEVSRIPYGYLLDKAEELVDVRQFDGHLRDSNYCSFVVMSSLLSTVETARITSQVEPIDTENYAKFLARKGTSGEEIELLGLMYRLSRIRANALKDTLICYEQEKVLDRYQNGEWQNPYQDVSVCAVALSKEHVQGKNFVFSLRQEFFYRNLSIRKVELDGADGKGFRTLSIGGSMPVTYASSGIKVLKLRITLSNGDIYLSHTRLSVDIGDSLRALSETNNPPAYSYVVDTKVPYKGVRVVADVSSEVEPNAIRRPLIVVEGFDPRLRFMEGAGAYGFLDYNSFIARKKELQDYFDIIYIDFRNSSQYIQANAELLIQVIRWVNQHKQSVAGQKEPIVLLGQSMGGTYC